MKILAIAKIDPQTTPEKLQSLLEAETKSAWKLYKEGTVREMYDRKDRQGVIFLLESGSVNEAQKSLDELPFVHEKLIHFDIIPLEPFSYFETLFRDEEPLRQG